MGKKLFFQLLFIALIFQCRLSFAQAGYVHTVAGGGTSTVNGIPATSASLANPTGIGVDATGNVYFVEHDAYRIRKIDAVTGIISTVAGNGTMGLSGDGGPATDARFSNISGFFVDPTGNIYIGEGDNCRVRKVDAATGIIHTVVGGGTLPDDGVLATAASLGAGPSCIFVDNDGNIYCQGLAPFTLHFGLRKVNAATGIITTLAGQGISISDGVAATSQYIAGAIKNICLDNSGNIYVNWDDRLRKIDGVTGIISTVAGGGGSLADGVPATDANLGLNYALKVDAAGNLFIANGGSGSGGTIRRVDATTGIINTIAGGGTSISDGVGALSAQIYPNQIYLDAVHGTIYYSDSYTPVPKVREFGYSPIAGGGTSSPTGSFSVGVKKLCNGPEVSIVTPVYIAGRSVKTYFGDGITDSSAIVSGVIAAGYATVRHSYPAAGTYIIKQVLFNGAARVDSISYSYSYTFCRSLPVMLYFDDNGNCLKDNSENYSHGPALVEVDSNGTAIKQISVISEFSYNAYGLPGDIYNFKVVSSASGASVACPASGIISETVSASVAAYPVQYFGLSCPGAGSFDNSVHAVVPVTGVQDQWGDIFIRNNSCLPMGATVTLHYSKKYSASPYDIHPAAASYTDSTITWDLTGLSADITEPVDLYYSIWSNPATGPLAIGDTVHSYYTVTPILGDSDPSNNSEIIIDTVRAGCDPNEMFVSPSACLASGTIPDSLQYTIHFENTGNDTAHNIYVMDTLSALIDPASVRIITASATMNIQMLKNDGYNIIRFDFPEINLLDSSHHGECEGAVIFSVKTNAALADGTQLTNRSGIYFDINPVVMTNMVVNTKGCIPAFVRTIPANNVIIFPNPATTQLTIQTAPNTFTSYTITNSIGQTMLQQDIKSIQTMIDIKNLPSGVYYISLTGTQENKVEKFIKW